MKKLDLAGKKYGRLTLINVIGVNTSRQRVWLCKCDCGNNHEAAQGHLTKGKVTSCGCYRKERARTHGMTRTPEWFAFQHAKARCSPTHKNHKHYFDRGIRVTISSFEEFYAEVGPRPSPLHSLDRKDNDKGYELGNLRWATKSQQERNRRCDNCILLKQQIAELEKRLAEYQTLYPRVE
jgi:hypothetical protein